MLELLGDNLVNYMSNHWIVYLKLIEYYMSTIIENKKKCLKLKKNVSLS